MKASESRLKNERSRKRTKSGGCPKNSDQHKNSSSSPKNNNSTDETKYSHSLHETQKNRTGLELQGAQNLPRNVFIQFNVLLHNNSDKKSQRELDLNSQPQPTSLQIKRSSIQNRRHTRRAEYKFCADFFESHRARRS